MAFVIAAAACGPPAASSVPSAVAFATPSAEISEAIRFRTEFGLRADRAYVENVANDPAADSTAFGIPLLPAELAELQSRVAEARAVAEVVREYGATLPDAFGGEFIDSQTGTVVALFVDDLGAHRAALRTRLHPDARLDVRPVEHTKAALDALMEQIVLEQAWLEQVGAPLREADLEERLNRVSLLVGGIPDGGIFEIHAHFQVPPTMLFVVVSPSTLDALPRGSVEGQLVDVAGNDLAIRDLEVRAIGDISSYEPDGGIGINTRADGSFEIPRLAEMGWTIEIIRVQPGLPEEVIGSAHFEVVGGRATHIEIPVEP